MAYAGDHFLGRTFLPTVGSEVAAPQDDAIFRQSVPSREAQSEPPKILRLHPRVTAELVYLVRRGLYQEVATVIERLQNRGLDNQRMRRADRVDAHGDA